MFAPNGVGFPLAFERGGCLSWPVSGGLRPTCGKIPRKFLVLGGQNFPLLKGEMGAYFGPVFARGALARAGVHPAADQNRKF